MLRNPPSARFEVECADFPPTECPYPFHEALYHMSIEVLGRPRLAPDQLPRNGLYSQHIVGKLQILRFGAFLIAAFHGTEYSCYSSDFEGSSATMWKKRLMVG